MKSCQWIGLVCYLLFASTGCNLFNRALYTTVSVLGDPDSLYFAKQRAGIGTFPVQDLKPPQDVPQLGITYGDEDADGIVDFIENGKRTELHYLKCLARIEEVLKSTSGTLTIDLRVGKRDLDWEPDFHQKLKKLAGAERLQVQFEQVRSSATP